jgi:hypothetical protein
VPPSDIREQVRDRYGAAATQVTSTDPGAGCCGPSETFDGGSEVFGAAEAISAIVRARKPGA